MLLWKDGREMEYRDEFDFADRADADTLPCATYEFRWDVEVAESERKYGQKFMKQWRRVLQAQKMLPLVSGKMAPLRARVQLVVAGEVESPEVTARAAEVIEELAHLRWSGGTPEENIAGEPAGRHPAGWQGVRVWMAFARQDVEAIFQKKAKI
jgi:hypothetical protein